jgi:polyferredoxin
VAESDPQGSGARGKGLAASTAVTVLLAAAFALLVVPANAAVLERLAASIIYVAFLSVMAFLILLTGKFNPWRKIFFISLSAFFILEFICKEIEVRGTFFLTLQALESNDVPICHIAISLLLIPLLATGTLFFPTDLHNPLGFYTMAFSTLAALVLLGGGFCSWFCFVGGLDELFASMPRKKRILDVEKWPPFLAFAPLALFIIISAASALALKPLFCQWLCPFKTVFECAPILDAATLLQFLLFVTIGAVLIAILPLLTGKRTQCGLFCPFGTVAAFFGALNPFKVRRDMKKCIACGTCRERCPLFVQTWGSLSERHSPRCGRCGMCIDACPQGALEMALPFGDLKKELPASFEKVSSGGLLRAVLDPGTLYVSAALLIGCGLTNVFAVNSLVRIFHLVLHGTPIIR